MNNMYANIKEPSAWEGSKIEMIMRKASIMKKRMEEKGLTQAKAKCPFDDCCGYWHATLAGKHKHIHFYCDGTCKSFMMT